MWQEGRDVGPKEARDPALQWGPCALPLPRAVCLSLLGCPDLDGRLIRQLSCGAEGVSCRAGPGRAGPASAQHVPAWGRHPHRCRWARRLVVAAADFPRVAGNPRFCVKSSYCFNGLCFLEVFKARFLFSDSFYFHSSASH